MSGQRRSTFKGDTSSGKARVGTAHRTARHTARRTQWPAQPAGEPSLRRRDEATSATKAVEARGLVKVYQGSRDRRVRALDGIDLTTGHGEFLVLLGPSGCGKTTLLRTIAGLERPTAGEVRIDGQLVLWL